MSAFRGVVAAFAGRRIGRLVAAALLAAAVWLGAQYVGSWLAAAVSFVLAVVIGALVSEKVPTVVERASGAGPLNVAIGADVGLYSDGWSLVLARDLEGDDLPRGLESLEARSHLVEFGAFDPNDTHLLLTLEGRSVDEVRIVGLFSRVTARQAPLSGAVVRSPSAGEQRIVAAYFDLDRNEAPARSDDGNEYFRDWTVRLARGESFMFRIIGRAERSACEWELLIRYLHRGSERVRTVDNAGRPFRTAARSERVASSHEWAWYEQPTRLVQNRSG